MKHYDQAILYCVTIKCYPSSDYALMVLSNEVGVKIVKMSTVTGEVENVNIINDDNPPPVIYFVYQDAIDFDSS